MREGIGGATNMLEEHTQRLPGALTVLLEPALEMSEPLLPVHMQGTPIDCRASEGGLQRVGELRSSLLKHKPAAKTCSANWLFHTMSSSREHTGDSDVLSASLT